MNKRKLICVVLAAGKGTRMKSDLPKVLHQVAGEPMVRHVVNAAQSLSPDQIIVVIGPDMDAVADAVAPHTTVIQHDRLGTGHAVKVALDGRDLADTDVMVLFGDHPSTPSETLRDLLDRHRKDDRPSVTMIAMKPDNPHGYGRLVTGAQDYVEKIVEHNDATEQDRQINLCNSGMMIFASEGLADALARLKNDNAKGEYYQTELVALQCKAGGKCAYVLGPAEDMEGVNDREQLAAAEKRMQQKLRIRAMRSGVTMIDPDTVYLSVDTQFGQDITIEPNVVIGPDVVIENNVTIKASSYIAGVRLQHGCEIGPFVHIRAGSDVGRDAVVANFVEMKKAVLQPHAKISQFACVVDADVGAYANVGAGTIISNWNGVEKFRTKIGDYAFIGGMPP